MNGKDDLQHLLPEEHRDEMAVLPRRSLKYGVLAVALLFFGLGMAIGSIAVMTPYAVWIGPFAVACALALGWLANRRERAVLESARRGG